MSEPPAIFLFDDPSASYHSGACRCEHHCGNCRIGLDAVRSDQDALAALGRLTIPRLHPLARYCSPFCKGVAKRDRALDRRITASCTAAMRSQP
jgi:hypothetical protein